MQAYFATIERHELNLPDRRLDVPTGQKVLAVGAMMWDSGQFTSKQMHNWENKPAVDKTWDNIKDYFTQQWQEQQAYNKMTEEAEVAEQNVQIFTLMQTQHNEQMKKIVENMAKMQTQHEGFLKQKNKENHNPNVPIVPGIVPGIVPDPKIKYKPNVLLGLKSRLNVRWRGASARTASVGVGIRMQTVWSWRPTRINGPQIISRRRQDYDMPVCGCRLDMKIGASSCRLFIRQNS